MNPTSLWWQWISVRGRKRGCDVGHCADAGRIGHEKAPLSRRAEGLGVDARGSEGLPLQLFPERAGESAGMADADQAVGAVNPESQLA